MNCTPAAMAAGSPAARATSWSVWMFFSPTGSNSTMSSRVTTRETGASSAPASIAGGVIAHSLPGGTSRPPSYGHEPGPARGRPRRPRPSPRTAAPLLELVDDLAAHLDSRADDGDVEDLKPLTRVDRLADVELGLSEPDAVARQDTHRCELLAVAFRIG